MAGVMLLKNKQHQFLITNETTVLHSFISLAHEEKKNMKPVNSQVKGHLEKQCIRLISEVRSRDWNFLDEIKLDST